MNPNSTPDPKTAQFRKEMEERLASLQKQGKRPIRKVLAKVTSSETAEQIGEICKLDEEHELEHNQAWIPIHRELGSWKFPDIFPDSPLIPCEGGITSDSYAYLLKQKERFRDFSGLIELSSKKTNGEVKIWKGHQSQAPAHFEFGIPASERKLDRQYGATRPPQAIKAIFARSYLEKVFQLAEDLNLPPEAWPVLENAFHAGRNSTLVDRFQALSDDQINYELTSQRKQQGPRGEWTKQATNFIVTNPAITASQIASRLEEVGLAHWLRDEKAIEVTTYLGKPRKVIKWSSFNDAIKRIKRTLPE